MVARRAGTRAETTVTTVPTRRETQIVRGSICIEVLGRLKPIAAIKALRPLATNTPRPIPMADAPRPIISASSTRLRIT